MGGYPSNSTTCLVIVHAAFFSFIEVRNRCLKCMATIGVSFNCAHFSISMSSGPLKLITFLMEDTAYAFALSIVVWIGCSR